MNKVAVQCFPQAVSVQSVEVPELVTDTEVLIEVRAASLDPVDLKVDKDDGDDDDVDGDNDDCEGYDEGYDEDEYIRLNRCIK